MIPRAAARPLALAAVVLTAASVLYSLATVVVSGTPFVGPLLALIHLGELAAAVAVVACGAAGRGALPTVGLGLTALGQLGLTVAELLNISSPATAEPFYSAGPLLSGVGMIVLGAAVLRARVWAGPARALPLVVGLWMLVVTVPTIIAVDGPPALPALICLIVWDLLWLGTAVAVLRSVRTATPAATPSARVG